LEFFETDKVNNALFKLYFYDPDKELYGKHDVEIYICEPKNENEECTTIDEIH
jgi:hypothetical protein